jgi:hypothetical protein
VKWRYTISIAAVLLVAATVVVGRAVMSGHPASSATRDDGLVAIPTATAPSTRPGAEDPTSTAESFARTWIRGTTMTAPDWRRALAVYSTGTLARQFDGVDPSSVPAHTLTGVPTMTSTTPSYVVVDVPTDAGTLILGLRATDGVWHVDTVDWTAA